MRSIAALSLLDAIIRTLSLTTIDANDPNVPLFSSRDPGSVFYTSTKKSPLQGTVSSPAGVIHSSTLGSEDGRFYSKPENHPENGPCECASLSLGHRWASAAEHTPLWISTPAWDDNWDDIEVQKESCRRLVWSTVLLTAAHSSYTMAHRNDFPELFVSNPTNVRPYSLHQNFLLTQQLACGFVPRRSFD